MSSTELEQAKLILQSSGFWNKRSSCFMANKVGAIQFLEQNNFTLNPYLGDGTSLFAFTGYKKLTKKKFWQHGKPREYFFRVKKEIYIIDTAKKALYDKELADNKQKYEEEKQEKEKQKQIQIEQYKKVIRSRIKLAKTRLSDMTFTELKKQIKDWKTEINDIYRLVHNHFKLHCSIEYEEPTNSVKSTDGRYTMIDGKLIKVEPVVTYKVYASNDYSIQVIGSEKVGFQIGNHYFQMHDKISTIF